MNGKPLSSAETGGRNQSIDLMKLVLSVWIVLIHAEVELGSLIALAWASLPLFFLVSGYFFFRKWNRVEPGLERSGVYFRFLKRNMKLYLFWFLLLLPVTLYIRDWFSGTLLQGVVRFAQSLLFNSTFRASWYIMALTIGVGLVVLASRIAANWMILAGSLVIYLICCLFSNYYGLVADNRRIIGLYQGYLTVFQSLHNSFPAGLFWIAVGKYLAETERCRSRRTLLTVILLSGAALFLEHSTVTSLGLPETQHCYLSYILFCPAVFLYVKDTELPVPLTFPAGRISTVVYAFHASAATVVGFVLRRVLPFSGDACQWMVFAVTMGLSLGACGVIFALEKKPGFGWLRNAS